MTSSLGLGEYKKNAVAGATPLQLVVMLYDEALKCCECAKTAIIARDLETQHKKLSKAQKILSELVASLDMERGAEIAKNLFALYSYCLNELSNANIHDKIEPVEKCMLVLEELRGAWAQLCERGTSEIKHAA